MNLDFINRDILNAGFASLTAVHWLRPQWLWLLSGLPLLAWWWHARQRQRSVWRDVVDAHLLPQLLEVSAGVRARSIRWLVLLGVAIAICALAGPSWQRVAQPLWHTRAPLVIALDLSSASLADDQPPSRLLQARAKIATLLRTRAGGQVGLVAFADDAYTVAPLTEDAGNIALFLDALEPDVMPVDGSRADRAIAWSAQLLRQGGFNDGDILLLTDHSDASARAAAQTAARNGYRVSALGLGTPAGAAYRDADGRILRAQLDAVSLQRLATAGGGAYVPLVAGDDDLAELGVLESRHAGAMAEHGETTRLWRDQGYWLLPPVLLLMLWAFRRGGVLTVLLLCVWLPVQPAKAANADWWRRPDQQAHMRLQQGADAYRKNDFGAAETQWRGLPGADATYNHGNALARQGDYDAAIAAYDKALQLEPGMADAIANRNAVEAAKKRKPPAGKRQAGQGEPKHGGDNHASQQQRDRQPGQPGDQTEPKDGGRATAESKPAPSQTPRQATRPSVSPRAQTVGKPSDAAVQREADAAQRRRMQQALRSAGAPATGTEAATPQRAETAAERERRLANEAWLRRVPDDPGGLLRARFRLEYERRQQEGN